MYKQVLLILLYCLSFPVYAQQYKANWEQVEKFGKIVDDFKNDLTIYPHFINDTDCFWYKIRTGEGLAFYLVDPVKKVHKELFDMPELLAQMGLLTNKAYTSISLEYIGLKFSKDGKKVSFSHDGNYFEYNLQTGKLITTSKPEKSKEPVYSEHVISPDSCYYVYAYRHNLYCYGNKAKGMDTTVVQLTTDGERYCSYAAYPSGSPDVESAPAGRWLKDSKTFLVEMCDERDVQNMYLIDMLKNPRPKLKEYRYCSVGDTSISQYFFRLANVETKQVKDLRAEKWKDQKLEFSYDDSKEDSEIFFYRRKRTWNEKELCAYNIQTGELRIVFNEVDKPYFDYVMPQTYYLNDADEILYRSERTGFGHFYLYDGKTGKQKRAVTKGEFVTGEIIRVDATKREMYLYAYGREKGVDPYYKMAYRVNLDKPGIELLTPENASHTVYISPSGKYIIDSYSRVDLPSVNVVRNQSGKEIMKLKNPDLKPIIENGWRFPERFCVKAATE